MDRVRIFLLSAGVFTIAALAAAAGFIYFGVYNVAATRPHWQPVYWLLQTTAVQSIKRRARDVAVPDLSKADAIARGLTIFRAECVKCHGAPGVPPEQFAMGFEPAAPPLAQTGAQWDARELYWVIRHGIKMTAMPAWEFRISDNDTWAVVAFLRVLPRLSPVEYARMKDADDSPPTISAPDDQRIGKADPERGRLALHQYACNTCHEIPGISSPEALVGPPLRDLVKRRYIAGVLLNTPDNVALWIQHPQSITPHSAMPDLGVTEMDARNMTAYLLGR